MTLQQLPREILYNICQYLDVKVLVDFQEALPAVSHCGIFSDLKKENEQNRKVAKEFYEWLLFFYKKYGDFKERVLNSHGCLHGKIFVLNKINIKISAHLFEDLNVYYSVKEKLRKEHNLLAKVMNLREIEKEAEDCPSCKRRYKDILNHLESDFPRCYEKSRLRSIIVDH